MLVERKTNNKVKVGEKKTDGIFSLNFGILFILQKPHFGEERWHYVEISHCKLSPPMTSMSFEPNYSKLSCQRKKKPNQ